MITPEEAEEFGRREWEKMAAKGGDVSREEVKRIILAFFTWAAALQSHERDKNAASGARAHEIETRFRGLALGYRFGGIEYDEKGVPQ